jgi:hypothetical protein
MNSKNFAFKALPLLALTASTLAAAATYSGPNLDPSEAKNADAYWKKYCGAGGVTQASATIPQVNYADSDVQLAATKLNDVADTSYYFYSGPAFLYKVKTGSTKNADGTTTATYAPAPASAKDSQGRAVKPMANAFLTILCGEFRDRPSLIKAKVDWVKNIQKLPTTAQAPIKPGVDLWQQVSAQSYGPYTTYSRALWSARQQANGGANSAPLNASKPVEGTKVCEVRFIFNEIAKGASFTGLPAYNQAYSAYEGTAGNCTADDKSDYYDFRGDSNFKPNSPESNAMIWYSQTISAQCSTTSTPKAGKKVDCADYFSHPFASRWNAARAGLGAWLLHADDSEAIFGNSGSKVTVIPDTNGASAPFHFDVGQGPTTTLLPGLAGTDFFTKSTSPDDLGFNTVMKLGTAQADVQKAYQRLSDSVNRHTDWYAAAYNDGVNPEKTQAYSPFVASSYEMSASNEFTQQGVTVGGASDGFKQWMFVFRIKGDKWYNSATAAAGKTVDFDRNWFDETSLGTNGLAKSEHAWDRVGTALEGEMDAILYLHNITTNGAPSGDGK